MGLWKAMKQWIRQCGVKTYRFWRDQDKYLSDKLIEDSGVILFGRHTYCSDMPVIHTFEGSSGRVRIGSFCSIAKGVVILTDGVHPVDWVSTFPFRMRWKLPGACEDGLPVQTGDIEIGSDVWIATEAVILPGVNIGHGSVIAARSVVTKDIPPYAIVVGTPARVIRYRFPPEVIEALLRIKWWEWDDERILEAVPLISSNNVQEFIRLYDSHYEQ